MRSVTVIHKVAAPIVAAADEYGLYSVCKGSGRKG